MKILCVDDKVENLYLLQTMLRGFGYESVSAHNGMEALQKLREGGIDLIVSDILMPQMDGFELCHQVKHHPTFRDIPFIFYTATYTDKKDEEFGLSLGASRFIIKPVEPDRFQAIIKEVIEKVKSGRLTSALPLEDNERVLLRNYNRRLIRKMDQKLEQLEALALELNAALMEKEHEICERRRAEERANRLNAELEERVRQRTAELEAVNKELATFTSAVSHDLRAPLRGIAGWSEALAEEYSDTLDEQAKGYVTRVQSEVGRMGALIERLLQLCRSSRKELQSEPVNLSDVASKIANDLKNEDRKRSVEFVIAPNAIAQGDPVLFRALLQNLLENAWKFSAKRSPARIEFGVMHQHGEVVYFVRDNGVGFSMDKVSKLFTPFERLHRATDFPGTGIGLATVHQIVLRHGGRIWAEGEVDKGATFYFTLK